jgi:polyhydroxyalkanoate synthesis regulator phasin
MTIISSSLNKQITVQQSEQLNKVNHTVAAVTDSNNRLMDMMKMYHVEHQAQFLDLKAEVDSLLTQLQTLKEQREHNSSDHNA